MTSLIANFHLRILSICTGHKTKQRDGGLERERDGYDERPFLEMVAIVLSSVLVTPVPMEPEFPENLFSLHKTYETNDMSPQISTRVNGNTTRLRQP